MAPTSQQDVQAAIDQYIEGLEGPLREVNRKIHETPELAYKEVHAHQVICDFLAKQEIPIVRHAYGLSTAFEARFGDPNGRCMNFNAEYDALPGIGYACGHNLIATASITGFLTLAFAVKRLGLPGQAQLLGTPAEEDGGGKIDLIRAGAYKTVDVSLMIHPMSDEEYARHGVFGVAGWSSIACYDITSIYRGVSAHAAASPWEGINALDAVVSAYNNISMLHQQIQPDDRIHGAILQAPSVTNAIPELTRTKYSIRSRTLDGVKELGARVRQCLEAGALATGCKVELEEDQVFANLIVNQPLCEGFQQCMKDQGSPIWASDASDQTPMSGSTDQGNVSQMVPALHGIIGIPVSDGAKNHTRQFTAAAGSDQAHRRMITAGKAMAMTGWMVLTDEDFYQNVRKAFLER